MTDFTKEFIFYHKQNSAEAIAAQNQIKKVITKYIKDVTAIGLKITTGDIYAIDRISTYLVRANLVTNDDVIESLENACVTYGSLMRLNSQTRSQQILIIHEDLLPWYHLTMPRKLPLTDQIFDELLVEILHLRVK